TSELNPFKETRTNPCGSEGADHLAFGSDSLLMKCKDILHADNILFHARNFRDTDYFAGTIAHTGNLNHDINGRGNLLAHGTLGQVQIAHGDHRFESAQSVARRVGVNGGHRAFVARIHGLEHVECFLAAHLAKDDAIGAHTQTVDQQL